MKKLLKIVSVILLVSLFVGCFAACRRIDDKNSSKKGKHAPVPEFTLSFDPAGGSEVPSVTLAAGAALSAPEDPAKEGHSFAGWFLGEEETPYEFSVMPEGNLTLTAHWTVNSYTITFNSNGGSAVSPMTADFGAALSAPADPSRTGYSFAGWFLGGGAGSYPFTTMPAGNITLTARWKGNGYAVSLHPDEGTCAALTGYEYGTGATLPVPEKAGYAFAGWFDNPDLSGTPVTEITKTDTGDREYWAKWTVKSCTISFETADGSAVSPITANFGAAVSAPEAPSKEGHTFAGWFLGEEETPYEFSTMPAGDITLTAHWTVNSYTITFNSDGGSDVAAITADYGAAVSAPANPSRTGYSFSGWFPGDGAEAYSFTTMPAESLTLTAHWEANEYAVSFDPDGGSAVPEKKVRYGAGFSLPVPVRTGYDFTGWKTEAGASLTSASGEGVSEWNIAEDVRVKAGWTPHEYTITYENTLKAKNENPLKYTVEDSVITLKKLPDGEGREFERWADAEGNEVSTINPAATASDVTLRAVWTLTTYDITYVLCDKVSADNTGNPETYTPEDEFTLKAPETDIGYDFTGWFDSETGGNRIEKIEEGSAGNKTLYARCAPHEYTITCENLHGASNPNPDKYTIESEKITLQNPGDAPGYTFVGWFDAESGGTQITEIPKGSTGDKTLYARWNLIDYTITYENLGGVSNPNPGTYTCEDDIVLADLAAEKGYAFGWFDSASGGNKVTEIPHGSTGDRTLYARWELIEYSVTYANLEGATHSNPGTYDVTTATIVLSAPSSRTGYDFAGWRLPDGAAITEITNGSTGNLEIRAVWTAVEYDIIYDLDGGTNDPANPDKYTIESGTITLRNPSRAGYEFTGWSDSASGGNEVTEIPHGGTGNITLYAGWELIEYTITYENLHGAAHSNPGTYNVTTATITLSAPDARPGCTFEGWYDTPSFDHKVTEIPEGSTGDKVLYADWDLDEYYIMYKDVYSASNSNPDKYTVDTETITLRDPGDRPGHTFLGWFDAPSAGNEITQIPQGSTGDMILYARWELIEYTITYENLEGASNSNPDKYTVTTPTIVLSDPGDRTGYVFAGWSDAASGGNKITEIPKGGTGDRTLYANWLPAQYKITYENLCGATHTNPPGYSKETETITLQSPSARDGYTFAGWFDALTGGTQITQIPQDSTGDKTLYARWTPIEYAITYKHMETWEELDPSAHTNPETYTVETAPFALSDPAPVPNYDFEGWFVIDEEEDEDYPVTGIVPGPAERYRGVYFTSWRPDDCMDPSAADKTFQDENGYALSTVYWFRYEPVKWRVVAESAEEGEALLLCDTAIDARQFDFDESSSYGNDFTGSSLLAWLEDEFLNTAFDPDQLALLSGYDSVSLPDDEDVSYPVFGLDTDAARQKKSTDYAKALGCRVYDNGNCRWWLSSGDPDDEKMACCVEADGTLGTGSVRSTSVGVVPVVYMTLENLSTLARVDAAGDPDPDGEYVLFGSYPQTLVPDAVSAALGNRDSYLYWESCGFYAEGTDEADLMETAENVCGQTGPVTVYAAWSPTHYQITYEDEEHGTHSNPRYYTCDSGTVRLTPASSPDGYAFAGWFDAPDGGCRVREIIPGGKDRYRGVYFTDYRPYICEEESAATYQAENGYNLSTVYWFKYEPVLWRVLSVEEDGTALLFCETAIDYQQFDFKGGNDNYDNNYKESTIRAWLNGTFLDTAFSEAEKALIKTTTVDNSAASTGADYNPNACENTSDKIFLLSFAEAKNPEYGMDTDAARRKKSTDYAKAQGCRANTGSTLPGNCSWWLRSPWNDEVEWAHLVFPGGYTDAALDHELNGVVPALRVSLSDDSLFTRVDAHGDPDPDGGYVLFGEYPQTRVANAEPLSALGGYDPDTWTSYNYYISNTAGDFMQYADREYGEYGDVSLYARRRLADYAITYENLEGATHENPLSYNIETPEIVFSNPTTDRPHYAFAGWYADGAYTIPVTELKPGLQKYRGVYFTQYRPKLCSRSGSADDSYQDENGYNLSTAYWFKYEPVKWRILNESGGKALILCETAIDSRQWDFKGGSNYKNNYAESTIRTWLNDTFYNTAFNSLQQILIQTTAVDNGAAGTGIAGNKYACVNTEDKIFLLSYADATNAAYGLNTAAARMRKSTDYAKAQGCYTNDGKCYWWLRSPGDNNESFARYVDIVGDFYPALVSYTSYGIVPALTISLSDESLYTRVDADGNLDPDGEYILFGEYPQTRETDPRALSALGGYDSASDEWTSYGYYVSGSTGGFMQYADRDRVVSGDLTLYAKWTPVKYNVTYELDGGTNNPANPSSYTIESLGGPEGEIPLKPPAKPKPQTRTSEPQSDGSVKWTVTTYTFEGWYTENTFTNKVTELSLSLGTVTLYAKWNESVSTYLEYKVSYVLNGGTNNPANPSSYTIESLGGPEGEIPLKPPAKPKPQTRTSEPQSDGSVKWTVTTYTFEGWYTEDTFTNKVTELSLSLGTVTLYAKWNESVSTTVTMTLNEALNVPGGTLEFVTEGTYPWMVEEGWAKSTNEGIASSESTVSTTVTVNAGDILRFDFTSGGEGTNPSYDWDNLKFKVDDTEVIHWALHNEWETYSQELEAGEHTLSWTYKKDNSVDPTPDYARLDNVYVGAPTLPGEIKVEDITVAGNRHAQLVWEVLPVWALDKSVTFATADETIATVDEDGIVVGVAEGTTTLTVTSVAVPTLSATAAITVTEVLPVLTLDSVLNVEGGVLLHFVTEGGYPWVIPPLAPAGQEYAKSSNEGVHSSSSSISTEFEANEGEILRFDFQCWGEGTGRLWDKLELKVDGVSVIDWGEGPKEWTTYTYPTALTAGSHKVEWIYSKDDSGNKEGDHALLDNVYVGPPPLPDKINVEDITVAGNRHAQLVWEVLPEDAFDKSVTFATGNEDIATVDEDGIVVGVAEGTTTLTVTSVAAPAVSGTAAITVTAALPTTWLNGYIAYNPGGKEKIWGRFADYDPSEIENKGAMEETFAGAFAGGKVYGYRESGESGEFYVTDAATHETTYPGAKTDKLVLAMAYNHADHTMYALAQNRADKSIAVYTVNLAAGTLTHVAPIQSGEDLINTLAIDGDGNAYGINLGDDARLWKINLVTGECTLVGSTGKKLQYAQGITWDFASNKIYWAQYYDAANNGLCVVDPATGAVEECGVIGGGAEVTALWIPNDLEDEGGTAAASAGAGTPCADGPDAVNLASGDNAGVVPYAQREAKGCMDTVVPGTRNKNRVALGVSLGVVSLGLAAALLFLIPRRRRAEKGGGTEN